MSGKNKGREQDRFESPDLNQPVEVIIREKKEKKRHKKEQKVLEGSTE